MNAFEDAIERGEIDLGEYGCGGWSDKRVAEWLLAPDHAQQLQWPEGALEHIIDALQHYTPTGRIGKREWAHFEWIASLARAHNIVPLCTDGDLEDNAAWVMFVFCAGAKMLGGAA